jgi:hypothetical protein
VGASSAGALSGPHAINPKPRVNPGLSSPGPSGQRHDATSELSENVQTAVPGLKSGLNPLAPGVKKPSKLPYLSAIRPRVLPWVFGLTPEALKGCEVELFGNNLTSLDGLKDRARRKHHGKEDLAGPGQLTVELCQVVR